MTRTMPDFPEGDLAINNHHPDMETRTYEIQVITPLFGGGVEAGKGYHPDTDRLSSIRGHLRFWGGQPGERNLLMVRNSGSGKVRFGIDGDIRSRYVSKLLMFRRESPILAHIIRKEEVFSQI